MTPQRSDILGNRTKRCTLRGNISRQFAKTILKQGALQVIRTIWLVISAAAAIILSGPVYDLLPQVLSAATAGATASDYWQLFNRDLVIETVGMLAVGGVILTVAGFTIPALVEGGLIGIARRRIRGAHDNAGPKAPFDKASFENALSHAPFLERHLGPYVRNLIAVQAEKKSMRTVGKSQTHRYDTLQASCSAHAHTGSDAIVNQRLFLWLFHPLPALFWTLAIISAAVVMARVPIGEVPVDWSASIPAFALTIALSGTAGLLIHALTRPFTAFRRIQADRFADELDLILQFKPSSTQIHDLHQSAITQSRQVDTALKNLGESINRASKSNATTFAETFEKASSRVVDGLRRDIDQALSKPIQALVDASTRRDQDQSAQVQQILQGTLKAFVAELEKNVSKEIRESQRLVRSVTDQAIKLEKSYTDTNNALAKQAKTQASDLTSAFDKTLKNLGSLEKANQATTKVINTAASDLKEAAKASRESVESFVELAEKMRQATNALKNTTPRGVAGGGDGKDASSEVGRSLRKLRNQVLKDLPKL